MFYVNRRLAKSIAKAKELEHKLQIMADYDFLTKVYNRRKIDQYLEVEIDRARRYGRNLSLIFFDIDDFKKVNDILGHKSGDLVLQQIASLGTRHIRKSDLFGRWGGEEFVIILPETGMEDAKKMALSLKELISSHDFGLGESITCSFGISSYMEEDDLNSLVLRADNAMYDVKKTGKNGVKTA